MSVSTTTAAFETCYFVPFLSLRHAKAAVIIKHGQDFVSRPTVYAGIWSEAPDAGGIGGLGTPALVIFSIFIIKKLIFRHI